MDSPDSRPSWWGKPRIICLCGSTRFKKEFEAEEARLTLASYVVLTCGLFAYADDVELSQPEKQRLDWLHLDKIDLAQEIRVINPGGYIGESTAREIEYAKNIGKPVTYLDTESPGR